MNAVTIVFTVIQLLACLFLIAVILLQSGKSSGLSGAIGGSNESYSFKAKSKTWDAKFARWTKWVALAFVLLTFVLVLL